MTPLARALPALALLAAAVLALPGAAADPGGTSPNTCFANAEVLGYVKAHALCDEPASQPCLLKVKVLGVWIRVCELPEP